MRTLTLQQLSEESGASYIGDPNYKVSSIETLRHANGSLSFIVNDSYLDQLKKTKAGILITSKSEHQRYVNNLLLHENPYYIYALISQLFKVKSKKVLIHKTAIISESCNIAEDCQINPNVVIGSQTKIGNNVILKPGVVIGNGVSIGDNTIIHPNVSIYDNVKIGSNVQIHANTVLGSDGFGFAQHQKNYQKIEHFGTVIIKDHVEIGANTSIDKGALEDTVIEEGVKIDNLVQIAHNVKIGKNTVIAGQTGIAGSAIIGKNCQIGGAVSIIGHISICDNVLITGTTAVGNSINQPGIYSSGLPADNHNNWRRNILTFNKLYKMYKDLRQLKKINHI